MYFILPNIAINKFLQVRKIQGIAWKCNVFAYLFSMSINWICCYSSGSCNNEHVDMINMLVTFLYLKIQLCHGIRKMLVLQEMYTSTCYGGPFVCKSLCITLRIVLYILQCKLKLCSQKHFCSHAWLWYVSGLSVVNQLKN